MPNILRGLLTIVIAVMLALPLSACKQKAQEGGAPGEAEITPMFSQKARMLETALKEDPNSKDLLVQLGNLYYDWGQDDVSRRGHMADPTAKWTMAIDYYRRALKVDPRDVNVRVDMATLMRFLGRYGDAVSELRNAISIDPKHPQARINLILTLGDMKDFKGAVKEYDGLIKAVPEQKQNLELMREVEGFKARMKEAGK